MYSRVLLAIAEEEYEETERMYKELDNIIKKRDENVIVLRDLNQTVDEV